MCDCFGKSGICFLFCYSTIHNDPINCFVSQIAFILQTVVRLINIQDETIDRVVE